MTARPYLGERDYPLVRRFLADLVPRYPPGVTWEVRRWDGWYWPNPRRRGRCPDVRLWEASGRLVAVVFAESDGDAHPQLHPAHRALEAQVLSWAEDHLARAGADGRLQLEVPGFDADRPRLDLLRQRGYTAVSPIVCRCRPVHAAPPAPTLPAGYELRAVAPGDTGDYQRIADLLNTAFGRDVHTAAEFAALVPSPGFRFDLNLLAQHRDGSVVAYVGLTYDPDNRLAIVEPVCTHPDHRRRGLARALLDEGIARAGALGATTLRLDTGANAAANALYASAGFTEAHRGWTYRRTW